MKFITNTLPSEVVEKALKEARKGTFQHLGYISYPTTLKRAKQENVIIRKQTRVIARFGIEYQAMKCNKNKECGSMLWGKYEKGDYNYIVTNGENRHLVAYVSKVIESVYFIGDNEVKKEWLIENKYISDAKSSENPSHRIQPKTTNIFEIGKLKIE